MRKLDMHCHVLPGMDDGAKNEKVSRRMLQMAYREGVRAVIATPHYSAHFRNDEPDKVLSKCAELEIWARQELNPKFRVYGGQEIFYAEDVPKKLSEGELLTMAGSSYVLIEFLPSVPYSAVFRAVRELTMERYQPILAHIERYRALREPGRVEELLQAGARMQMNYRSIGGRWYENTARWCRKMLQEGNIQFLGTDMHDTEERSPGTMMADRWMEAHLDTQYIRDICRRNAERLLENERI